MRDFEEVEEFVLEVLKNKKMEDEETDILYHKVINRIKLNEVEKEWLITILGEDARKKTEEMMRLGTRYHSLLSEIDVISIFADAWGQYCLETVNKGVLK